MWAACASQETTAPPEPPLIKVGTVKVKKEKLSYYDVYPATVVALNEVLLRAQVTGYITQIHFKDGAFVSKDSPLYTIDAELYDAQLNNARALFSVREAELNKARQDLQRYEALLEANAVARQRVDDARIALEAAQKNVEAAGAHVRSLATNLKFTTIKAPFSGIMGISQVRLGATVVAGQTLLNTLSSVDPVGVDFNIEQNQIFTYQTFKKASPPFSLYFDSLNYPYKGSLLLLDRSLDPTTGTLKLRVSFPNPKRLLKAGMVAEIKIPRNPEQAELVIPYKAVSEYMGEYFVYRVSDSQRAQMHYIRLGRVIGDRVVVKTGITEGESIVVEGMQKIKDGARVAPVSIDTPS